MRNNRPILFLIALLTGLALTLFLTTTGISFAAWDTGLDPNASLTYNPTSLNETITLGGVVTHTLTLQASGADPATVTLQPYTTLLDRVYGVYATATDPRLARFQRNNPGTLSDMGLFANGSVGGDFAGDDFSQVYAIANNDPFNSTDDTLVAIDTTTGITTTLGPLGDPTGFESFGAMSYDPVTQQMYAVSSYVDFFGTGGNTLYTVDLTTGAAAAIGTLTSPVPRQVDAISFDGSGTLYGEDLWTQELVTIDVDALTINTVAATDVWPEFNSGMDWDPATNQMYLSIWRTAEGGELRTIDLTTGQTTLVGGLGTTVPGTPLEIGFTWIAFASAEAPWLSVTPDQVTVPANGSANVDIVLNTHPLYQTGSYAGFIAFNGLFDNNVPSMPITMQVNCATCGVLQGSFTDAWTSLPLEAQLHITSNAGMDIHLPRQASYSATVPAGSYTLVASAPGYLDETSGAVVTNGGTTTQNLALTPKAGLLAVNAAAINVTTPIGPIITRTLTVSNTGTIPLTFTVRLDNLDVPVAMQNATLSAIQGEAVRSPEDVVPILAYGVNHPGTVGGELAWFNLSNPGTLLSANLFHDHGSLGGGDFWGDDFTTLYGFEESRLIALDTATGAKQYVGALPLISTYSAYDGMAYDATTGTMYLAYDYDCFTTPYVLYTVDVTTAAATAVGDITGSIGCLGDIAVDDSGHLYGIDIDNNTLVQIDTTTAAATVIGGVGFDIPTFEQGLAWDSATDQMYLTVVDVSGFPFIQKLYRVNLFTGEAIYLNDIGTVTPGVGLGYVAGLGLQAEVIEWAQFPTEMMTIPAGASATLDLVFDTRSIYRTGDYTSDLIFEGTFINPVNDVPVALHLSCATCGTLTGAITAHGSGDPLPANLHITGPGGFAVNLSGKASYDLTVRPGSYTIQVERAGYASESATVQVAATGTTTTNFALTAEIPVIILNPATMEQYILPGTVVTRTFRISNAGLGNLPFTIRDEDLDAAATPPALTSCGTPDAFGYACIDSNTTGGPTYNWVDISTTGTSLGLDGANDYYGMLELPFAFNYYGTTYDEIAISSYGQIYFEDRPADPDFGGNQPIPSTISGNGVQTYIAPYWGNLNYDLFNNPQSFYEVQGIAPHRRLIIQWNNITANWANAITFQVILFEDSGNILMQYQTLNSDTGDQATIGIQGNETTGLEYGYNEPVLADNLAVCFVHPGSTNYTCALDVPDASWLTETPGSGVAAANSQVTISVVFDATGLTLGDYQAEIYLGGPDNPPYVIPITLHVVEELPPTLLYLPIIHRH